MIFLFWTRPAQSAIPRTGIGDSVGHCALVPAVVLTRTEAHRTTLEGHEASRSLRPLPPDLPGHSSRHPRGSRRSANHVLPATGLVDHANSPAIRRRLTHGRARYNDPPRRSDEPSLGGMADPLVEEGPVEDEVLHSPGDQHWNRGKLFQPVVWRPAPNSRQVQIGKLFPARSLSPFLRLHWPLATICYASLATRRYSEPPFQATRCVKEHTRRAPPFGLGGAGPLLTPD